MMKFVFGLLVVSSGIVCSHAAVVEKAVAYEQAGLEVLMNDERTDTARVAAIEQFFAAIFGES